jgi:chromosome segregation ATPase
MAELERKQARLTYFGALAVLIAIAAAGAALYFGLTNRSDSAKKTDLDALTERVDSLEGAVTKSSKDTQNALNASIAQLQQSISGLQKQQKQASTKISTLQTQVAANAAANAAAPPSTTTTPTTPGGTKKR